MDQSGDQPTRTPKVVVVHGGAHWGLIWGFIILIVGVALLLDHMGVIPFDYVYHFWPSLLVLFGIMNLISASNRGFGFMLIVAGLLLQLNKLGFLRLSFADLWPVAIIGIGILMIWGSLESRGIIRKKIKFDWTQASAAQKFREHLTELTGETDTSFNAAAVFGGCERRYTGQHLQSGKATSIFGGVELDLRDANIDDEAVLEITCLFGGVEIRVPETWTVHSRSLPIFGGFEDKTRQMRVDEAAGAKQKTLVVTGVVVFGGVEISN
jgi:predicted membrane protein